MYCRENRIKQVRFKDVKETFVHDVSEKKTFAGSEELYPEDMENLLYFLKT